MAENKKKLPKFGSLDELVKFFDENDTAPYWDEMPEVDFNIDLDRRAFYVEVESELAEQINEISKREHVSSGAIVNSWLRERLSGYPHKH